MMEVTAMDAMPGGLSELYQQVILEHNAHPRNFGAMGEGEPTHTAKGYNPLCGDELELQLVLDEGGRVASAKFTGSGCAISTASASLMTEALKGKTQTEVTALFEAFHHLVTSEDGEQAPAAGVSLGKLAVLQGVKAFPMRVKCATLAWHTLRAALVGEGEATTE